jgi:lysozyme family protein
MVDFTALTAVELKRWQNAKLTRKSESDSVAKRLVAAKTRYQVVEYATGVRWFVIAVIHERESSQDWKGSLAQGDDWSEVSVHVPKGRGPFGSWESAAIDALVNCPPQLAKRKDWTLAGVLIGLELYNGLGYATKGVPSPYLWSGTDQYTSGKYVRDGVYDPGAVDKQLGCCALLKSMMALDPSISFDGTPTAPPPVAPSKPAQTPDTTPSGLGALISAILSIFFKRKS